MHCERCPYARFQYAECLYAGTPSVGCQYGASSCAEFPGAGCSCAEVPVRVVCLWVVLVQDVLITAGRSKGFLCKGC